MSAPTDAYDAASHYDRVSAAWRLLLGPELHYGLFATGEEDLQTATGALTTAMIEAARLAPGLSLLDVGCGTGAPGVRLAADHGVAVLGISTSAVGVAAAQEAAAAAGVDARFEVRDGADTGLPGESFDRVWLLESSHLVRDRDGLIGECSRVLRPGGRLVLCDIIRRRDITFAEVRARRADFARLRAAFGDAHMEPLSVYAQLAEKHGLTVEERRDVTDDTRLTFDRWRANASRHEDEVTALLGQAGFEDFVLSLDVLDQFWADGTLGYGLFVATKPTGSSAGSTK